MTPEPGTGSQGLADLCRTALDQGAAWCRRHLLPRLLGLLAETRQSIWSNRVRSFLLALPLAVGLLAAFRIAPALYGRFALAHAAGIAARQLEIKGEDRTLLDLRRQAFELGFPEAALEPGTFRLEITSSMDSSLCTVSYRFTHVVNLYGLAHLPMRIQGKVTQAMVSAVPTAAPEEAVQ